MALSGAPKIMLRILDKAAEEVVLGILRKLCMPDFTMAKWPKIICRQASWHAADNKQSLEVEFEHLVLYSQKLALAVVDAPKIVLPILDKAAKEAVLEDWPEFINIHSEIFVRFPTLTVIDSIRNLRCAELRYCPLTASSCWSTKIQSA